MQLIFLQNSKVIAAMVDDTLYEELNQFPWQLHSKGYIIRYFKDSYELMHARVLGVVSNVTIDIDHLNGLKHDNQKQNLRLTTRATNLQNNGLRKDCTSGFKGVTFSKKLGKYQAKISFLGERIHAGTFLTAQEAANAYDQLALKYYGPNAQTNAKLHTRKEGIDPSNLSLLNLTTPVSSPSHSSPNQN